MSEFLASVEHGAGIEVFFFGTPGRELFGIYEPPLSHTWRDCGVVLCPPMAREYLLAHRSYRQLANRLAQRGFAVLRFDFYGCGDSAGASEEGCPRQWLDDVSTAIAELRRKCGSRRVCLAGLRLGATLAAQAGVQRHDVESMVLWNPVVKGGPYMNDMRMLHRLIFKHLQGKQMDAAVAEQDIGILGYRLTDAMRADLAAIDLYAVHKKPATKILVMHSSDRSAGEQFAGHLLGTGAEVDSQYVPFAPVWTEGIYKAHVPGPVLNAIANWIGKANA